MDAVSRPQSDAYAKALAAQEAVLKAFARPDETTRQKPDDKVILNAQFQMLAAAQQAIDAAQEAALAEGVGGELDTTA